MPLNKRQRQEENEMERKRKNEEEEERLHRQMKVQEDGERRADAVVKLNPSRDPFL